MWFLNWMIPKVWSNGSVEAEEKSAIYCLMWKQKEWLWGSYHFSLNQVVKWRDVCLITLILSMAASVDPPRRPPYSKTLSRMILNMCASPTSPKIYVTKWQVWDNFLVLYTRLVFLIGNGGILLVFYQLIPMENLVGKFWSYKFGGSPFFPRKGRLRPPFWMTFRRFFKKGGQWNLQKKHPHQLRKIS